MFYFPIRVPGLGLSALIISTLAYQAPLPARGLVALLTEASLVSLSSKGGLLPAPAQSPGIHYACTLAGRAYTRVSDVVHLGSLITRGAITRWGLRLKVQGTQGELPWHHPPCRAGADVAINTPMHPRSRPRLAALTTVRFPLKS